jgi:hypothetical protein
VSCGVSIAILLTSTVIATAYAVYCEIRMARMVYKVFRSDAIATGRANKIQELQMRIESMKYRK